MICQQVSAAADPCEAPRMVPLLTPAETNSRELLQAIVMTEAGFPETSCLLIRVSLERLLRRLCCPNNWHLGHPTKLICRLKHYRVVTDAEALEWRHHLFYLNRAAHGHQVSEHRTRLALRFAATLHARLACLQEGIISREMISSIPNADATVTSN